MNIDVLIYLGVVLMFVLLICIPLKFMDLGISLSDALSLSLLFPVKIFRLHLSLCKEVKKRGESSVLKFLFSPIVNLPVVLVWYAHAFVQVKAKIGALEELMPSLSKVELKKLKLILEKEQMDINIGNVKVTNLDIELSKVFGMKYLEFSLSS